MRALTLSAAITLLGSLAGCGQADAPRALDEIRARGELRVVTLNLPTCYYFGAQGAEGLEFELVRAYAARLRVKLAINALAN
ncbi:MAG: lytic transglycosylase F, partial [Gammaproteobacteria bacterium]